MGWEQGSFGHVQCLDDLIGWIAAGVLTSSSPLGVGMVWLEGISSGVALGSVIMPLHAGVILIGGLGLQPQAMALISPECVCGRERESRVF